MAKTREVEATAIIQSQRPMSESKFFQRALNDDSWFTMQKNFLSL